jgi:predicted transcriptional regulator
VGVDGRRRRGDLAQEILDVLTAAAEPMTPSDVQAAIDAGLAYTTVMTVLARLHTKGVLARERRGRTYAYSPLGDPARVTARRMHRLLNVEPDRAGVLAGFVDDLTADDERTLRALLNQASPGHPA